MTKLRKPTCKSVYRRKKINKLFAGLGSVRIVKNSDLGLENAALGLRPRAAFSRPRSQFFTIRTSQPANNIYILIEIGENEDCCADCKPQASVFEFSQTFTSVSITR